MRDVDTTFVHIRGGEHGSVTVAYCVRDNVLNLGVALCSPKEQEFNKAKGRKVAEGRMSAVMFVRPCRYAVKIALAQSRQDREGIDALIAEWLTDLAGPRWYREFIVHTLSAVAIAYYSPGGRTAAFNACGQRLKEWDGQGEEARQRLAMLCMERTFRFIQGEQAGWLDWNEDGTVRKAFDSEFILLGGIRKPRRA